MKKSIETEQQGTDLILCEVKYLSLEEWLQFQIFLQNYNQMYHGTSERCFKPFLLLLRNMQESYLMHARLCTWKQGELFCFST